MLRRHWFAISAGAICFVWALAGWLTVIPNQDILADSIQVQSLINDPRIVLAFPGQKHAGPLEYPFGVFAEAVAPGNFYLHSVVRLLLAFLTGFFTAKLYLALLPTAKRWSLLASIAVGPTIIHGLLGPASNPVGVWWLQPNWDMAWLCVTAGAYVIARQLGREPNPSTGSTATFVKTAAGGLLVGLGFYAHPAISILIVPILTLLALRFRLSVRAVVAAAVGAAIGVVPAAASYVVNASVNLWDPSHGPMINVPMYGTALGIDGIPDYMLALLPYGLGLAPGGAFIPPAAQSILMWIFLFIVVSGAAIGTDRAWRSRTRPSVGTAIAITWLAACLAIIGFSTLIDPVWIYSSGLAILFWISVGVLPSIFSRRWVGVAVTGLVLLMTAGSTIAHNADWYSQIPTRMQAKQDYLASNAELASAILATGATYIYGSYYYVIPVGYASGYQLRTVTNHYNRFPLTEAEAAQGDLTVAVETAPIDSWGKEALIRVQASCTLVGGEPDPKLGTFAIFTCPSAVLANPQP